MAKFKFNGTTIEEVESELQRLCSLNIDTELPLNHILKVIDVIGVTYIDGATSGSTLRFHHDLADYYGGYFSVHRIHGGKQIFVKLINFKKYMMPPLNKIIEKLKFRRDN